MVRRPIGIVVRQTGLGFRGRDMPWGRTFFHLFDMYCPFDKNRFGVN